MGIVGFYEKERSKTESVASPICDIRRNHVFMANRSQTYEQLQLVKRSEQMISRRFRYLSLAEDDYLMVRTRGGACTHIGETFR